MAVLEVKGVTKAYGERPVLHGVDLSLDAGEVVALLGPNGAGKTTLISIIAGLRRPDDGWVTVGGVDMVRRPKEGAPMIGLAPQDLGVYPVATVRENLRYFGELAGLRRGQLKTKIDEAADAFFLTPLMDRLVSSLSGGEARRAHTAMALLHRPPLLLLDEPTVGADVRSRSDVLDAVKRYAVDGAAVCYSTHYLAEVEMLGASIAILDRGRIIARGSLDDVVTDSSPSQVFLTFTEPVERLERWEALSSVNAVTALDDGATIALTTATPADALVQAVRVLRRDANALISAEVIKPSLESVFFDLTGRTYKEGADDVAP